MDISLPISDSSAGGMFSAGASARSADSGRFSQTLSKEMADQPEHEPNTAQASSAQKTQSQQQARAAGAQSDEHAEADSAGKSSDDDTDVAIENRPKHSEKAGAANKGLKKITAQNNEAATDTAVINVRNEDPSEVASLQAGMKLTADSGEKAEETVTGKSATPTTLEQSAAASTNSALASASTNPALVRSNAVHDEIFRSIRSQTSEVPSVEAYAGALISGKPLQNSGKDLPLMKTAKAGEQLNTSLPASAQDWKYTADSLITAVSDKAAKFDSLNTQFNSQSVDTLSILNTGTGRTLTAQSSFKSELAAQDTNYTALSSDFLAGSEEWCQDFGTKIEWMSKENVTKAELSLHPAELGVLDITINTEDDRISISIVTHNEKSREMLESSMPRLNELLKSQGLALENSNISHNSASSQQNAHAQQPASSFSLAPEEQQTAEPGVVRSALIRHQGQIDHYV